MLGGRGQGGGEGGGGPRPRRPADRPRTTPYSQAAPPDEVYDAPPAEPSGGDDIPF